MKRVSILRLTGVLTISFAAGQAAAAGLLNVSYDVARGLYQDLNRAFVEDYRRSGGEIVKVDQSHGGSGKQARAVIDGLAADVVTMNSPLDIDVIADAGLLPKTWADAFPQRSSPSWSTIVFVVRKGNPLRIADWPDLTRADVKTVLPNPKTSGNGRYSYLAAWHYARSQPGATDETAIAFEKALFRNVPVLDIGGRDATTTFAHRGIGDVLLTFESEAKVIGTTFGADRFEIVYPSVSVRADNPVAVVEKNAARKGSTALAEAYLTFHYGKAAQAIFAEHGLRIVDPEVAAAHAGAFPPIRTFTVEEAFGGWPAAQAAHFASGARFDRIIAEARK